ncbi:GNAT family N-acetyltransferase [Streptomyces reniochalinae]|uniref:GNAT family N-acetyltransferase n=1 Tax=Streptomyces reniochalinae TaxID=2250578 RepID=A0A367EJA8_9ACTN|nr:GNAT family N-acetyltransferase [Streptomyces reniochalinae]RCG18141.1 GNAT family N-acetyltransferase [Streptomyces reniochalinae]
MANGLQIRTLATPDDFPEWLRAVATGFYRGPAVSPEEVAVRGQGLDTPDALDRTQGAYDGARCVGTFRTTPQELTVPGGSVLPACAVTAVTVSPTHRRRGLLTAMTANALDAAKERGDACASLIAAEYPIYGRYGFGPAAEATEWEVHVARTGLDRRYAGPADAGDGGRVDLEDAAGFRASMPAVHARFRTGAHRQGAIDRNEKWWRVATGELRYPDDGFTAPFHAVYRDAEGHPQGGVTYASDNVWQAKQPEQTLTVQDLFATTAAAEAALWRYVLAMDWVQRVRTGLRAPDDVLRLLLPDPRAARTVSHTDWLWIRPLDVPRMLTARTYAGAGASLVLDVRDKDGYAAGRFRLETGGPRGAARCTATREEPDLTLDVAQLAALYLGDESAVRLAALGLLAGHREGAVERADALFRTARRPWCPDMF